MSTSEKHSRLYHIRQLAVFQLKLAVDALRDLILSPLSLVATVMDLIEGRTGKHSYFEKVLQLGRLSENRINLFNQYRRGRKKDKTVDSVVDQIEAMILKEYQDGELSAKAKSALEKTITTLKQKKSRKVSED